uniref:Uncharacterized protein n=1 Tax=Chromera velia CCMP2878 TaxID=1169474 RepID=A0A0G4GPS7_9ALVE|eukprot:Cvel_5023.t1-p1 / transcript=Cvel_5023.t1 / gene=Cvel_5023 / organism=Chromera_velia_CCMP2878 / gene_product=hypothetical protein / transcript_product=hypothetical protein / location=Cvel_scaffold228:65196-67431(-) / protein_length=621 / sequence_SO=supercontig / SO=protein_coding / is_pseudo=false
MQTLVVSALLLGTFPLTVALDTGFLAKAPTRQMQSQPCGVCKDVLSFDVTDQRTLTMYFKSSESFRRISEFYDSSNIDKAFTDFQSFITGFCNRASFESYTYEEYLQDVQKAKSGSGGMSASYGVFGGSGSASYEAMDRERFESERARLLRESSERCGNSDTTLSQAQRVLQELLSHRSEEDDVRRAIERAESLTESIVNPDLGGKVIEAWKSCVKDCQPDVYFVDSFKDPNVRMVHFNMKYDPPNLPPPPPTATAKLNVLIFPSDDAQCGTSAPGGISSLTGDSGSELQRGFLYSAWCAVDSDAFFMNVNLGDESLSVSEAEKRECEFNEWAEWGPCLSIPPTESDEDPESPAGQRLRHRTLKGDKTPPYCSLSDDIPLVQREACSFCTKAVMLRAVIDGDVERVKECVAGDPNLVHAETDPSESGIGPVILLAAFHIPQDAQTVTGHAEIVRFLLDSGADPRSKTNNQVNLPAVLAQRGKNPSALDLLGRVLTEGADPDNQNGAVSPLFEAAWRCDFSTVNLLLNHGAFANPKVPSSSPHVPEGFSNPVGAAAYHYVHSQGTRCAPVLQALHAKGGCCMDHTQGHCTNGVRPSDGHIIGIVHLGIPGCSDSDYSPFTLL